MEECSQLEKWQGEYVKWQKIVKMTTEGDLILAPPFKECYLAMSKKNKQIFTIEIPYNNMRNFGYQRTFYLYEWEMIKNRSTNLKRRTELAQEILKTIENYGRQMNFL